MENNKIFDRTRRADIWEFFSKNEPKIETLRMSLTEYPLLDDTKSREINVGCGELFEDFLDVVGQEGWVPKGKVRSTLKVPGDWIPICSANSEKNITCISC